MIDRRVRDAMATLLSFSSHLSSSLLSPPPSSSPQPVNPELLYAAVGRRNVEGWESGEEEEEEGEGEGEEEKMEESDVVMRGVEERRQQTAVEREGELPAEKAEKAEKEEKQESITPSKIRRTASLLSPSSSSLASSSSSSFKFSSLLLPTLRPYQVAAVRWMLRREMLCPLGKSVVSVAWCCKRLL